MVIKRKAYARHAQFYLDKLIELNQEFLQGDNPVESAIQNEQVQIQKAYEWSLSQCYIDDFATFASMEFPMQGGDTSYFLQDKEEYIQWNQKGLEVSQQQENITYQVGFLINLGNTYVDLMRYPEAKQLLEHAHSIGTDSHFSEMNTVPYDSLGHIALEQGEYQAAIGYFQQAINFYKAHNLVRSFASSLGNLSTAYMQIRDWNQAHQASRQAVVILSKVKDHWRLVRNLNNLSLIYQGLQRPRLAISCCRYAMNISKEHNDLQGFGLSVHTLGRLQLILNHLEDAINNLKLARDVALELNDMLAYSDRLVNLALCYTNLNRYEEALQYYEEALKVFRATKRRHHEAICLGNLSFLYAECKEYEDAIDFMIEAKNIFEELGLPDDVTQAQNNIDAIKYRMQHPDKF